MTGTQQALILGSSEEALGPRRVPEQGAMGA